MRMSKSATRSAFNEDASASGPKVSAGRRLANISKPERKPSSPFSGRCSIGRSSHCGPPTAPSSTASASRAAAKVAAGSGVPWRSMAQPPISA